MTITKEQAIEALYVLRLNEPDAPGESYYAARKTVRDFINQDHPEPASAPVWRPMSEAPRDGTAIWAYVKSPKSGDEWQDSVYYNDNIGEWMSGITQSYPTHWMPLQPLPQQDARR